MCTDTYVAQTTHQLMCNICCTQHAQYKPTHTDTNIIKCC